MCESPIESDCLVMAPALLHLHHHVFLRLQVDEDTRTVYVGAQVAKLEWDKLSPSRMGALIGTRYVC